MVLAASHPHLWGQQVTSQATPLEGEPQSSSSLPDEPGRTRYPVAEVLPPTDDTTEVTTQEDTLSRNGSVLILDGDVEVDYRDRVVKADHIEYDQDTGDLTATGHLHVSGGANHEDLTASHGTMNLKKQTATFYDVNGSVGMKNGGHTLTYSSSNPFLFTGRMVVRTGPQAYEIYDGSLTTCQLPHPDWMLYAGKFAVDSEKVKAQNSTFRLMNIPILFLPYVTHPVDSEQRQSGLMIPVPGYSSTKGFTLGEEVYWAINRSTDLTVGAQYYSLRGWEQSATFRYRGLGNNFAKARYTGLLDRGIFTNGAYLNQGGEDALFTGRHDFSAATRVVGDVEYLSSYAYREAFAENFSVAVSSDILSILYGVHEWDGYAASARVDRYQGLKMTAVAATPTTPATPEEEVRIFHAPSLDFSSTEHEIGRTGLMWSVEASHAGLSRVQPNFSTGGLTQRFDVHPELSYALGLDGWRVRASVGARETAYSRSRQVPYDPGALPVELPASLNRSDAEVELDLRAPVVERTFDSSSVEKLFHGNDVKHTIEPELTYRYVTGVNNFLSALRFDDVDIVSNTNELEYGVTQRLFLRPVKNRPCKEAAPLNMTQTHNWDDDSQTVQTRQQGVSGKDSQPSCGSRPLISWRLTQKYFFNENFGGAVLNGRRNIFDTTLNFSGIAFLTEPRAISPLVSRMRVRTSSHMDVEWDFDLDTGAKKFTSNNVLVDVHENNVFAGLSYARLNAPGRFYTEGVTSAVSNFNQLRLLLGYGSPTKPGLGVAGNVGLDLNANNTGLVQYGAVQGSYNWDCCGFSVEVRKYELGSVRNETTERFNFTLLNIGTAGNLRRAASLF
ncbi:LPS-assembly protein LptD [Granulicella sp. S190]|uniref:LPS-assembly protein LptD n=1 Tax=Granulicella sp. S190 TaxID=1747226 RepID=UPI00131DF920|nr:LPS assembly protein LptD [Granulicella sp. S190]